MAEICMRMNLPASGASASESGLTAALLLGGNAGRLNDVGPALKLAANVSGEFFRTAAHRFTALRHDLALYRRCRQGLHHFDMELVNQLLRHSRKTDKPEPGINRHPGDARFTHRRHVGHGWRTPAISSNCQSAQLPAFDQR